jgi:Type III restriction enzyme, res subunit
MPNRADFVAFLQSFQSAKFQTLRNAQAEALENYNAYLARPDLGIELPTGAGKTLIALFISELWRRENKKVAILSANKTLARQMVSEAASLGVPSVLMEGPGRDIPGVDKRSYRRTSSIAVMNYWVYFNQNPVLDPADLLVMDDAHLAEHCLHSLYSVEINKYDHEGLFKSLLTELRERFPEYAVVADALADDVPTNSPQGYVIRGTIITHLNAIEPAADASAGTIRVLPKAAVANLWGRVRILLSLYRDRWSLDDINVRIAAAESIRQRIPPTGWLIRVLDHQDRFVTSQRLLAEWP